MNETIPNYQLEIKNCKKPKQLEKDPFLQVFDKQNKYLLYRLSNAKDKWSKETYKLKSLEKKEKDNNEKS